MKPLFLIVVGIAAMGSVTCPVLAADGAEGLLANAAAKSQSMRTFSADYTTFYHYPKKNGRVVEMRDTGTVRMMKPLMFRADNWILVQSKQDGEWSKTKYYSITQSDGRKSCYVNLASNEYRESKIPRKNPQVVCSAHPGLFDFLDPKQSLLARMEAARKAGQLKLCEMAAPQEWEGKTYQVVHLIIDEMYQASKHHSDQRIFVDDNGVVPRVIEDFTFDDRPGQVEYTLHNIAIDPQMTKGDFQYTLPAGAKPFNDGPPKPMLADLAPAPDFTVRDGVGKPVLLSEFRGKVVLLDFWATWCGPCQEALPATNQLAKDYKDKDVVVLAINVWDSQDAFKAWLPEHPEYDALRFAIDVSKNGEDIATKLYRVSGIPTQFVIGRDGNVDHSQVGVSDEKEVRKAIDRALASK